MSESVFKRGKVLFHVVGQGSIDIEYEVGAETPEQAFQRAYVRGSLTDIERLLLDSHDYNYVIECEARECLDIERELGMVEERESDEYARAREDEADQWRMNR